MNPAQQQAGLEQARAIFRAQWEQGIQKAIELLRICHGLQNNRAHKTAFFAQMRALAENDIGRAQANHAFFGQNVGAFALVLKQMADGLQIDFDGFEFSRQISNGKNVLPDFKCNFGRSFNTGKWEKAAIYLADNGFRDFVLGMQIVEILPFAISPIQGTPPWDWNTARGLLRDIFQDMLCNHFHPVVSTRQQNYEFCGERILNFCLNIASDVNNLYSAERLYKIQHILKLFLDDIDLNNTSKILVEFDQGVRNLTAQLPNGQALWDTYQNSWENGPVNQKTPDLVRNNAEGIHLPSNNNGPSREPFKALIIIGKFGRIALKVRGNILWR